MQPSEPAWEHNQDNVILVYCFQVSELSEGRSLEV